LLRRVKLARCLDTLPERVALAQTGGLGHAEFLELVLADEVTPREATSAERLAHAAGLDAAMTLDRWDDTARVTYNHATERAVLAALPRVRSQCRDHGSRRVSKTFLATALGDAACAALQRALRALRSSPQTTSGQPARQQS
jgi:hypothetical protein